MATVKDLDAKLDELQAAVTTELQATGRRSGGFRPRPFPASGEGAGSGGCAYCRRPTLPHL